MLLSLLSGGGIKACNGTSELIFSSPLSKCRKIKQFTDLYYFYGTQWLAVPCCSENVLFCLLGYFYR